MAITNANGEGGGSCDLTPTTLSATGVIVVCKVTLTVNTSVDYGYTASISSANAETRLVGANSATGSYINATTGTLTDPIALTNSTWGYAVPNLQSVGENGFDETYEVAEKDAGDVDNETFSNAKYAKILDNTSPTIIRKFDTAQAVDDTFDIYFATRIGYTQTAGNYTGSVTISLNAILNASPSICENANTGSACVVDLDANMIPINYTGSIDAPIWNKADIDVKGDWYDYSTQKWANAVNVKNIAKKYNTTGGTSSPTLTPLEYFRDYAPVGTAIPETDVLAYWVYIPRYEYQVCRPNATDPISFTAGSEPNDGAGNSCPNSLAEPYEFNIRFQNKNQITNFDGVTAGKWATHPAFTITDNTDLDNVTIEQVNGIWLGKFETTYFPTSNSQYDANYPANIKPSINGSVAYIIGGVNMTTALNTAKSFGKINLDGKNTTASNKFSFTSDADVSVLNNRQWGAAAYLTTSSYGLGLNQIWNNPNNKGQSGCAGTSLSYPDTTGCSMYYKASGQHSSTTYNTYGIYSMSGGYDEYTLGNLSNGLNIGTPKDSGFTAGSNNEQYYVGINNKYFDLYPNSIFTATDEFTGSNKCTWATCGGQALHETRMVQTIGTDQRNQAWLNQNTTFVTPTSPWTRRGGTYHATGDTEGLFFVSNTFGGGTTQYYGYRVSLILTSAP
jgi:hypothetical protein